MTDLWDVWQNTHVSKVYAAAIIRADNVLIYNPDGCYCHFSPPHHMNLHCHPCTFYLTNVMHVYISIRQYVDRTI